MNDWAIFYSAKRFSGRQQRQRRKIFVAPPQPKRFSSSGRSDIFGRMDRSLSVFGRNRELTVPILPRTTLAAWQKRLPAPPEGQVPPAPNQMVSL
jgi:hypothetical protein